MSESQKFDAERVRYVQNGRPQFFEHAANDKLLAMIMALMGEVCVLRDRLDAHERLLKTQGLFGPAEVDAFEADAEAHAERSNWREQTIARVLDVLNEDIARLRHE